MPDYRRRAAREQMSVRVDLNGIIADASGSAGVARDEVDALAPRISEITHCAEGPPQRRGAAVLRAAVPEGCAGEDQGAGGGGARRGRHAGRPRHRRLGARHARRSIEALGSDTPRVVVADNVDPWSFGEAARRPRPEARTTFNVISKSGETAETMAQFLIVRDQLLRQLGAVDYAKRVVITTDAEQGALRQVVHDEGFRDLVIPAGVGGRAFRRAHVGRAVRRRLRRPARRRSARRCGVDGYAVSGG